MGETRGLDTIKALLWVASPYPTAWLKLNNYSFRETDRKRCEWIIWSLVQSSPDLDTEDI